jgi:hypothetical protein
MVSLTSFGDILDEEESTLILNTLISALVKEVIIEPAFNRNWMDSDNEWPSRDVELVEESTTLDGWRIHICRPRLFNYRGGSESSDAHRKIEMPVGKYKSPELYPS